MNWHIKQKHTYQLTFEFVQVFLIYGCRLIHPDHREEYYLVKPFLQKCWANFVHCYST